MNLALRLFAGVIDLLQFIFFIALLALQFMTPAGGAAIGGVTGAVLCWNLSSGVVSGVVNAGACLLGGGALGAGLSLMATPIGMAIDIVISCTFGALLILALWVTGRFSFMAVVMGFGAEMLPGLDAFVPGWSILVHRCIKAYNQKQKAGGAKGSFVLTSTLGMASMIPGVGGALSAVKPALSVATRAASTVAPSQPTARVPLHTRNFDGIRPAANDNRPQRPYAQAA